MELQQNINSLPISVVLLLVASAALLTSEAGFRAGRWWQRRRLDEKGGPSGMIVGSLLALMGFLLATAMSMASDRFDTRRGLVVAEANSVSTTFLRAGYLPEPRSSEVRAAIREYVPLLIVGNDMQDVQEKIARAGLIHEQLWAIAEEMARAAPESDVLALYIASLNEMIDLHGTRVVAGVTARVPATVIALLLLGTMLTLGMVGYSAGLSKRRSPLASLVLIVILAAVVTLVIDLDRPRDGFLTVSQKPLISLLEQVGATR